MASFDIVIPTLNISEAALAVESLRHHSTYVHNYIVLDTGDWPVGYTEPCNWGASCGNSSVVAFVNDDITIRSYGWDEPLVEEAEAGTYCFYPWTPQEDTMKLNGWFFCLKREYINAYGWAFDPRFKVWCGDIDLIRRLEEDHIESVPVKGIDIEHVYSKTTSLPRVQSWIVQQQLKDIDTYIAKWGTDPNKDKVR